MNKLKLLLSLLIVSVILVGCQSGSPEKLEYESEIEFIEYYTSEEIFTRGLAVIKYVSHEEKEIYKTTLSKYDTEFNLEEYKKINKMKVKKNKYSSDKSYFIKEIGTDNYLQLSEDM